MPACRRATTLVELMVVLALVGVLVSLAVPRALAAVDRLNVHAASQDVVLAVAAARAAATRRGDYVSLIADPREGRVQVVAGGEVLLVRELARERGVRLEASRESITFAPTGLGWGTANTTLVLSRGGSVDTVVTSRLGRLRRN